MSAEIEWIEKCIKEKHIKYYEANEFNEIREVGSEIFGKVYKANWKQSYKCLKSFSLDHATVKEIVREIKLHWEVGINDMITKFYGITKTDSDKEYLLVLEYAEDGTLRNYLKEKFTSLSWQDKYKLALQLSSAIECLHEKGIVHKDLHSENILIQQNSIKLVDFGLSKRIRDVSHISLNSLDTIPYNDPHSSGGEEQIEKYKLNEKSDIYSAGVLFWELSSGKKPFNDREYNVFLAKEIAQGLRENIIEGTSKEYYNLYTSCWSDDPDKRPTIKEVIIILKSMMSSQQIIQQFKLNHGLFLSGHKMEPSKQAVFSENGILNISLYKGEPIVYTFVNDHSSHTNLLSFNPDDNNNIENLQQSDVCINFPVAEITYTADLSKSFSSFGDYEKLYEMYGHLFARKILVGGKLFINLGNSMGIMSTDTDSMDIVMSTDTDSMDTMSTDTNSFKSFLFCAYRSAKCNRENLLNCSYSSAITIKSSDGKLIYPSNLQNWMNKLYQDNMFDLISYNNLIPISELRSGTLPLVDAFHEKQPGVANFKEKLGFEKWVRDSLCYNPADLIRWVKDFHLFRGLIINKRFGLEISKKIAVDFFPFPRVRLSDRSYLKVIKPTTNLENFLISNNIFLDKDVSSFPFTKKGFKSDNSSYGNYAHFLVRCEQYIISFRPDGPSEEFDQAIEEALESMKPLVYLQDVFDEYGHFFPSDIGLGRSLRNISPNSSLSEKIELDLGRTAPFKSLKPHLDRFNISHLLTQKGDIIKENDLSNWFQKADNNLEIVKFDNIISLYDILDKGQQLEINTILNTQDNFKIIMTGIADLKDLDTKNTEHYKRINVKPSLEDEDYEVFGSIISENYNLRLKNFFVTFGLYDFNGFSAMIKTLNNTNIDITECYILWMIIGKPSKLSVFSPKNRELQVDCIKESISLQPNSSFYSIKTSHQLSRGDTISINVNCSTTNYEPISIKLVEWSNTCINFQFDDTDFLTNIETPVIVDTHICISSGYKSLKIDNDEKECYLDLIGYKLTKEIFNESGEKRTCENCQEECLATSHCKYCIRNYLKVKFSNWTSGNNDIDNLIQECQMESLAPDKIIEWIPYNNLQIDYLKSYCWVDGQYKKWNSKEQQLERYGSMQKVIIKLKNEEVQSYLMMSNKCSSIVQCYGLTQESPNQYSIVMKQLDMNLRKYLQLNHKRITWKERIKITVDIIKALGKIHKENVIHRNLHSNNILYSQYNDSWYISDLGFCELADNCIYGRLSYIAPEVIAKKKYTFESDIYSIAMLMWEISFGKPPFIDILYCGHLPLGLYDVQFAMNVVNGMRPKIGSEIPLEYKELMKQCWDAKPIKRPNLKILRKKIKEINNSSLDFELNIVHFQQNKISNEIITSGTYKFENASEPKNVTEEEQKVLYQDLLDKRNQSRDLSNVFYYMPMPSSEVEDLSFRTSKRQLSLSAETQGDSKSVKMGELVEESEPMEIDYNIYKFYDNDNIYYY